MVAMCVANSQVASQYGSTNSMLFMFCIAASASASVAKRTKPKPLLRPVSRSLTTTCGEVSLISRLQPAGTSCLGQVTYGLLDLTELLELLAQSRVISVPGKASAVTSAADS